MQKNNVVFIGIGLLVVVAFLFFVFYYSPNTSNSNEEILQDTNSRILLQGQETQNQKNDLEKKEENLLTSDDSIFCNGTYYTQCSQNLRFICPKLGEAYCESSQQPQDTAPSNSILCNDKYWLPCPSGYNFSCPVQGDAKCIPQNSISGSTNQAIISTQVENLLQEEISKQNSWYEQYLQKQAEIESQLKPINEEEHRITEQYLAECIQFVTGQKAQDCNNLTLRLNQLEAEARRISGIYPERKTLPQSPMPKYEQWRFNSTADGLSGTISSHYSTTQYRWRCINANSCVLESY